LTGGTLWSYFIGFGAQMSNKWDKAAKKSQKPQESNRPMGTTMPSIFKPKLFCYLWYFWHCLFIYKAVTVAVTFVFLMGTINLWRESQK